MFSTDPEGELLVGTLVFGLLLGVVSAWTAPGFSWRGRMGAPRWSQGDSWASSLALIGAVLGTAIAPAAGLPKDVTARFAVLSLLFAALVVIAPLAYNATRQPTMTNTVARGRQVQYQGSMGSFVLASVLILWAVSGQLATLFWLLHTLQQGKSTASLAGRVFQGVIVATFVGLIFYVRQSIRVAVQTGSPQAALQQLNAQRSALGLQAAAGDPPLPEWPLL